MIEFQGIWFPDHEKHLQYMISNKGPYQKHKYDAAMEYVKDRRRCIDVGGHVGLWSMRMVEDFDCVDAFEPVRDHRECFVKNVTGATLHPYALGPEAGSVSISTEDGSSGNSWVSEGDDVEMRTLDSFRFQDVDFIKIDCEGYEDFVLQGAEKTIRHNKPVIIVEQKPQHKDRFGLDPLQAVKTLQDWGMKERVMMAGDYIMTW